METLRNGAESKPENWPIPRARQERWGVYIPTQHIQGLLLGAGHSLPLLACLTGKVAFHGSGGKMPQADSTRESQQEPPGR